MALAIFLPRRTAQPRTQLILGLFLISMPLVYLPVLGACVLRPVEFLKNNALLAASSALGLAYLHHAYARADISHLAQAVSPVSFLFVGRSAPASETGSLFDFHRRPSLHGRLFCRGHHDSDISATDVAGRLGEI